MKNYVISDIHGHYDEYLEMLEKIRFSEEDMLYVLGDVLDRGPKPIQTVLDLMRRSNVVCLAGNHEYMAMQCLRFLLKEVTRENLERLDAVGIRSYLEWQANGADTTLREIHGLDLRMRQEVIEFLSELELYEEVHAGGRIFLLVHAGLGNFRPDREIWEYGLDELVWQRPDYGTPYFSDRYVVTGHTPTRLIPGNPRPGYIYQSSGHIAIDCGAAFGERLACLCLETMEEFYVACGRCA